MWKNRLGIIWLVVALGVLGISFGLRMVYSGRYDPTLGLNLILIGDSKIGVIGFRGETDLVNMVVLPDELVVEAQGGKGRYKIGSLWGLGKLVNKSGEEVMLSLSSSLGIKVTGYIKTSDDNINISSLGGLLGDMRIKTNLNWWDRVRLLGLIRKLLAGGTLVLKNIPQSLLREEVEPDGVRVLVFDGERIFSWSAREWVNPAILNERVNLAVFNNGGEAGRALVWERMLETAGVRVVEVVKAEQKTNGCRYRLYRTELVEIVKMLKKDYGCIEGGFESILGPGRVDVEVLTG
jgi:hypothetical protein